GDTTLVQHPRRLAAALAAPRRAQRLGPPPHLHRV
ncbi:MAG: hypothetical protein AVDCRST_MAG18-5127, partial [uncultured Thermomicrobiales bacterium]